MTMTDIEKTNFIQYHGNKIQNQNQISNVPMHKLNIYPVSILISSIHQSINRSILSNQKKRFFRCWSKFINQFCLFFWYWKKNELSRSFWKKSTLMLHISVLRHFNKKWPKKIRFFQRNSWQILIFSFFVYCLR